MSRTLEVAGLHRVLNAYKDENKQLKTAVARKDKIIELLRGWKGWVEYYKRGIDALSPSCHRIMICTCCDKRIELINGKDTISKLPSYNLCQRCIDKQLEELEQ